MRSAFISVSALSLTLAVATGCHSANVAATVVNNTPEPIPLIEVDYPSASFGTENLAPGHEFHYRFKILGAGPTKLLYTDSSHRDHTVNGPTLSEGMEGQLRIVIEPARVTWSGVGKAAPVIR